MTKPEPVAVPCSLSPPRLKGDSVCLTIVEVTSATPGASRSYIWCGVRPPPCCDAFDGATGLAACCTIVTVLCEEPRSPAAATTATTTPPPISAESRGMKNMRFIGSQDEGWRSTRTKEDHAKFIKDQNVGAEESFSRA